MTNWTPGLVTRPRISLICLVLLIATKRQDNFFSTAATRFHRRLHFFRRGLKNYYSMLNCSNEGMKIFDTRSRLQLCLPKLGVLVVSLNSRIMYERFERALLEKSSSDSFFVQCHKPSLIQSYQAYSLFISQDENKDKDENQSFCSFLYVLKQTCDKWTNKYM